MNPSTRPEPANLWLSHLRGDPAGIPTQPTAEAWTELLAQAETHQLRGFTYRLVADGPVASLAPAAVTERLREAYLGTAVRNALLFRQTQQFIKVLDERGIPVMLLKGLHLARFVYPEPALRNMADVDVMVPRDRLAEAEQVMIELGFGPLPRPNLEEFCTKSNHLAKLVKADAPVVELHWTIERPTAPFRIDLDGLWSRSRAAALDGTPVRLLSTEDLILHLTLHCSYHHQFDRSAMKGLVDLAAVVAGAKESLDWELLARRANEWGAAPFLYTTMRAVSEVLGTRLPPGWLDSLHHDSTDESMVSAAIDQTLTGKSDLPAPYLALTTGKGWRARAAVLWSGLFPPKPTMARTYGFEPGSPLLYWYYAIRPFDLLIRRTALFVAALRRGRTVKPAIERAARHGRIRRWTSRPPGA